MNRESIIGIIELSSIIITGSLGIAGTITHTKDKKGNLTRWGMVTVAGIMLTNSFSFITNYLKQKKQQTDQIVNLKKEKEKTTLENLKYKQTISLLSNNLRKSDTSLAKQLVIQKQSGRLLSQINQSIDIQNKTLKQSQVLNTQQHQATDNIERTLNPLLPFKVDLALLIKANPNSLMAAFTKMLKQDIDSAKNLSWNNDIVKIDNEKGPVFFINSTYRNYDFFNDRINHARITLIFSRRYKGAVRTLKCEVPDEYMNNRDHFKNIQALYITNLGAYSVLLENLPIKVDAYNGVGFSSTKDLKNASLQIQIAQAPGFVSKSFVKFRFPPDYSRINELLISHKGSNTQGSFYSTYVIQTPCKFKE